MKAVGIKELKARLSEYVRLVRTGETVLVTDRDEVVAELRPARQQKVVPNSLEEIFQAMAEEGQITRARLPKKGWTWSPKGLGLPPGTAMAILDELRK